MAVTRKKQQSLLVTGDSASARVLRSVRASGHRKHRRYVKPMLATPHQRPFDSDDWLFEFKWDGYRAVAEIARGSVSLYSRNGLSFLSLYPEIARALAAIKHNAVLDGEIVVLNRHNKPDFQKLQQFDDNRSLPILYYVFDCLYFNGRSVMHLPLVERKKLVQKLVPRRSPVKYSDHVMASGVSFFAQAAKLDLEGIIAKKANSLYVPGTRTREWLKVKNHNTQEAIIAGYTAPRGSRQYFGSLILAIMSRNKLKYIGHTGTGFTVAILKEVYEALHPLRRDRSPFETKVTVNSPVTWVDPVLVCNIKYTEVTQSGILRHPVFQGLRIDKSAKETHTLDVVAGKRSTSTASRLTRRHR